MLQSVSYNRTNLCMAGNFVFDAHSVTWRARFIFNCQLSWWGTSTSDETAAIAASSLVPSAAAAAFILLLAISLLRGLLLWFISAAMHRSLPTFVTTKNKLTGSSVQRPKDWKRFSRWMSEISALTSSWTSSWTSWLYLYQNLDLKHHSVLMKIPPFHRIMKCSIEYLKYCLDSCYISPFPHFAGPTQ